MLLIERGKLIIGIHKRGGLEKEQMEELENDAVEDLVHKVAKRMNSIN